ncbi:transcriptional regulator [bacterium]|nr:transcriptional regulator [bacterium]
MLPEILNRFLRSRPVFTGEELREYLHSNGETGSRVKEAVLAHQRNMGRVLMVRRGLYAYVPHGVSTKSHAVDPYLVAARVKTDAVLSYHTALEFYGKAYSIQNRYTYTAHRPPSPFRFQSREFRGVKTPMVLRRSGKEDMGVETCDRAGMDIRVTSLERTLVDVLDRPDVSGSWEEIWRSLESVEYFNLEQVIEYTLLLGNATIVAKVGFFLERHREQLMVEDHHLWQLSKHRPKQPRYLERSKRSSGRLVSAWNLVVPVQVLEQSWSKVL